jgi:hypothetical protein
VKVLSLRVPTSRDVAIARDCNSCLTLSLFLEREKFGEAKQRDFLRLRRGMARHARPLLRGIRLRRMPLQRSLSMLEAVRPKHLVGPRDSIPLLRRGGFETRPYNHVIPANAGI